jgi:DNA repair protein RecN (Recombination protein N)
MLNHLTIKNFLIIKNIEIDFSEGLSVITGQTGSGKSIFLEAIKVLLGFRQIKKEYFLNEEDIIITANFIINKHPKIQSLLNEYAIEDCNEILIRRVFKTSGTNKIFINDQTISLSLLKEIGSHLMDFNNQGDQYIIFNHKSYLNIIDRFISNETLIKDVINSYEKLKDIENKIQKLNLHSGKQDKEIDFLTYSIKEIEELQIKEGEEEELNKKRQNLLKSEKVISLLKECINNVSGNEVSIQKLIMSVIKELSRNKDLLSSIKDVEKIQENLERGFDQIEQANILLEHEVQALEYEDIDLVQERLFRIREVGRKHGCKGDELSNKLAVLKQELSVIENQEALNQELNNLYNITKQEYLLKANLLSNERKNIAKILKQKILQNLEMLHLKSIIFDIRIETNNDFISDKGIDKIYFEGTMNPGVPMGPIDKIASGGELSRFLLALKVSFSKILPVDVLIFDEIDTGVSGNIAHAIAAELKMLAQNNQVIVITHSTQITALADHHYRIFKTQDKQKTKSVIEKLSESGKREEIAKLLSGEKVSKTALELASELLNK